MARKRKSKSSYEISTLQDDLQELPVKKAVGKTRAQSYGRAQRIFEGLDEFGASEVAKALGVRTQKYNAIRRMIEREEGSTGALNDLLENAYLDLRYQTYHLTDEVRVPTKGTRQYHTEEVDVDLIPDEDIRKTFPKAHSIRTFPDLYSAEQYYAEVGGHAEYFVLGRGGTPGDPLFSVWDIRGKKKPRKAKKQKGD